MPRELRKIHRDTRGQQHIDDILIARSRGIRPVVRAPHEIEDLVAPPHQPLRHQKARREFPIMAGGAHDDRHGATRDADLERFFDGEKIVRRLTRGQTFDADDRLRPQRFGE